MAKKKSIDQISSSIPQLSDLIRYVISLPKKDQKILLDMIESIESMPDDIREQSLSNFIFGNIFGNDDDLQDEEMEYDGESGNDYYYEDDDETNYQHFLPRTTFKKYTLRVTLKGIKPPIYRKFIVPSNITLRHLSELLLELMGWEDEHLNQFRNGNNYYAPAYQREDEMPIMFGAAQNFNQEEYTLSDLLSEKGKSIEWEYDFGDSWCHEVKLSSIGEYDQDEPIISFVKGERACPPEDCGGIWGYQELLDIYAKKKSRKRLDAEEKERLEWFGLDKDFDPEEFDTDFAQEICESFCE